MKRFLFFAGLFLSADNRLDMNPTGLLGMITGAANRGA